MFTPDSAAAMRRAPDADALAWALAAVAAPHLGRTHRDRVYIALGIGETFAAIEDLITLIAAHRIPLSGDLMATVSTWLDYYDGHPAHPRLQELLTELPVSPAPRTPQAGLLRNFLATATTKRPR